jgi:hypothetical protein
MPRLCKEALIINFRAFYIGTQAYIETVDSSRNGSELHQEVPVSIASETLTVSAEMFHGISQVPQMTLNCYILLYRSRA